MAIFTSAQDFFVSNSQSKKFEIIQKPYVPRALCFSCQGPSRLREAKRAMGTGMSITLQCQTVIVGLPDIFLSFVEHVHEAISGLVSFQVI